MLDDFPADGQAESGALGLVGQGVADLLEALENLRLIAGGNADARVDDADDDLGTLEPGAACDRARVCELHRVRDQVDHDLDDAVGICGHRWQVALDVLVELQAFLFQQRRGGRRCAVDDVADRHRLHVPFELAGLDLGEVQDVVDELGEALALADDDLEVVVDLAHRLLHLGVTARYQREDAIFEALLDDLGEAEHGRQRRAQLVADSGQERALGGVRLFRRGPRALRFFEQAPDLVLVLVELLVGVGIIERDGRVRRQAAHHVQVMLCIGVLLEALDGDDAEDAVFGEQR